MGPRQGALAAVLLLAGGCGESEPGERHPSWHMKPRRYVIDRARRGDDACPASEGWRTLSWRIGCADPLRFAIAWSDARAEGPAIARIAGRTEAHAKTNLHVSVRERPPQGQPVAFACPHCGARWQAEDPGERCPECGRAFDAEEASLREVRIRAVPPIAELDAGPSFRREGDALVGEIGGRLVPRDGTTFDLATAGRGFDEPIERAVPSDIAFIFHLPPGVPEGSARRGSHAASYVWECGGIRIEGSESGYRIEREGRAIALHEYPLPVWRFAFRIEE